MLRACFPAEACSVVTPRRARIRALLLVLSAVAYAWLGATPAVRAAEDEGGDGGAAATVVAIKGIATAGKPGADRRELALKDPIHIGEVLQTGAQSGLQIIFLKDKTVITIGQKARLSVDSYRYKAGDRKSKCETTMTEGAFKVLSGAIGKVAPDRIKVKTSAATIGIRGTLGIGMTSPDETTSIFMGGHAISVTGTGEAAGNQTILGGQPGMGCETRAGEAPGRPRMFSPSEIQAITGQMQLAPPQDDAGGDGAGEDGDGEDGAEGAEDGEDDDDGEGWEDAGEDLGDPDEEDSSPGPAPDLDPVDADVDAAAVEGSQEAIEDDLTDGEGHSEPEPEPTPEPTPQPDPEGVNALSGKGASVMVELDQPYELSGADEGSLWTGTVDSTNSQVVRTTATDGTESHHVEVEIDADRLDLSPSETTTPETYSFAFDLPDLGGSTYSDRFAAPEATGTYLLNGQSATLYSHCAYDNLGEFFLIDRTFASTAAKIGQADSKTTGGDFGMHGLHYAGVPTPAGSLPTAGLYVYGDDVGPTSGMPGGYVASQLVDQHAYYDYQQETYVENTLVSYLQAVDGPQVTAVDFATGRAIAVLWEPTVHNVPGDADPDVERIMAGTVNSDGTISLTAFDQLTSGPGWWEGDGNADFDVWDWQTTSAVEGTVFGSEAQGLGFQGAGTSNKIGGPCSYDWHLVAGDLLDPMETSQYSALQTTDADGPSLLSGYAAGLRFFLDGSNTPSGYLRSMSPSDVSIQFDRAAGQVSASFTVNDGAVNETYTYGNSAISAFLLSEFWVAGSDSGPGYALGHELDYMRFGPSIQGPEWVSWTEAPHVVFGEWETRSGTGTGATALASDHTYFVAGLPTSASGSFADGAFWQGPGRLSATSTAPIAYGDPYFDESGGASFAVSTEGANTKVRGDIFTGDHIVLFEGWPDASGHLDGMVIRADRNQQIDGSFDADFFSGSSGPVLAGSFGAGIDTYASGIHDAFLAGVFGATQTGTGVAYAHMDGFFLARLDDHAPTTHATETTFDGTTRSLAGRYDVAYAGTVPAATRDGFVYGVLDTDVDRYGPAHRMPLFLNLPSRAADAESYTAAATSSGSANVEVGMWRSYDTAQVSDPYAMSYTRDPDTLVPVDTQVTHDGLGEFAFFRYNDTGQSFSFGGPSDGDAVHLDRTYSDYDYSGLGYVGVRAEAISTAARPAGISVYGDPVPQTGYSGYQLHRLAVDPSIGWRTHELLAGLSGTHEMTVNWDNGRVMGYLDTGAVFFGGVDAAGLFDAQLIRQIDYASAGRALWGDSNSGGGEFNRLSGTFFGRSWQGVGFHATGTAQSYDATGALVPAHDWQLAGAALRREDRQIPAAPTGVDYLEGYISGWDGPLHGATAADTPRMVCHSSLYAPDGLYLAVDHDNGVVSGSMKAGCYLGSTPSLGVDLSIGDASDSTRSAAVARDQFAAIIGDGTGDSLDVDLTATGGTASVATSGPNVLVTGRAEEQVSEWATWGEWATGYIDPSTAAPRAVTREHAFWVAGKRTAEMASIPYEGIADYQGISRGAWLKPDNTRVRLQGQCDMRINFEQNVVSGSVNLSDGTVDHQLDVRSFEFSSSTGDWSGGHVDRWIVSGSQGLDGTHTPTDSRFAGSCYGPLEAPATSGPPDLPAAVGGNVAAEGAPGAINGVYVGARTQSYETGSSSPSSPSYPSYNH
jgi:hypothetical protein